MIGIGFLQTTVMEMGQPAAGATPEMWARSLEYTGRVVAVSNTQVFDEPVFNYSRDCPYLWDEISVPVGYDADRALAERILLEVANTQTVRLSDVSGEALRAMRRRYFVRMEDLRPKVYTRITDNWLELTVRFVVEVRGVRDFKDAMNREILHRFDEVGIPIASSTMVVTQIAAPPPSPHPADCAALVRGLPRGRRSMRSRRPAAPQPALRYVRSRSRSHRSGAPDRRVRARSPRRGGRR